MAEANPAAEREARRIRTVNRIKIGAMAFALGYGFFLYCYPPARECRAKGGEYYLNGDCVKTVIVPVE